LQKEQKDSFWQRNEKKLIFKMSFSKSVLNTFYYIN
jgi:hypothetical protein